MCRAGLPSVEGGGSQREWLLRIRDLGEALSLWVWGSPREREGVVEEHRGQEWRCRKGADAANGESFSISMGEDLDGMRLAAAIHGAASHEGTV